MCGYHRTLADLSPEKESRYAFYRDAEWAPGPICTEAKKSSPPGFDPSTVQPIASRYTDYAIPAHKKIIELKICN